jgi:hypothetical protein
VPLLAPARILAQIQRAGLAGQAGITGQEPGQRQPFVAGKYRLGDGNRGGCGDVAVVIGYLPERAETPEGWASPGPSDNDSPHRRPTQTSAQGYCGLLTFTHTADYEHTSAAPALATIRAQINRFWHWQATDLEGL